MQAIKSVASVLAPYDSDQLIPVFGFGGRLPPDSHVSHCFPLNFNYERPEVYGVQVGINIFGEMYMYVCSICTRVYACMSVCMFV